MEPSVVLPKELRLAAPATMPQSRSYMFKQQAALSDYSPRDTIQINLPRLQRSYLTKDSYLEFEVTFTYTLPAGAKYKYGALGLDTPGALGLIDRIEVYDYLGSTQLESTAGFGQLVALLKDTSVNADEFGTHYEATSGAMTCPVTADWERWGSTPSAANTNFQTSFSRQQQPSIGEVLDSGDWKGDISGTGSAAAARTIKRRYHLPLFSFLGLLSPKYAPLHNGYTIMITLQSAENALISAGYEYTVDADTVTMTAATAHFGSDASFKVNNARMCCQILELGPIAESMLLSTTAGNPMIITSKAYRHYNTNVNQKSSTFRLDLNINVASLTNVLWFMRPLAAINSVKYASLSTRQRNFLESWYFQYGSSILPQTQGITAFRPMTNNAEHYDFGSECLIELLKARHMYNQPTHNHVFNKWNWAYDNFNRFQTIVASRHKGALPTNLVEAFVYPAPNSFFERGKFACGLDLELVSGRTNEIICGMNTNGMNTSIVGTFNATAAATTTDISTTTTKTGVWVEDAQVDAYCEYDCFINVSPGIATTVSF